MSGFDPAWLDLREAVDRESRAQPVLAAAIARFAGRAAAHVADLGAGSGAMLRAIAPLLPGRQRWALVDDDGRLFAHARRRLAAWADEARAGADGTLLLRRDGKTIEVGFVLADLAADPLPAEAAEADLVTASALFDLVGADWLGSFAARLAGARRPLYASLTYDGRESFAPTHAADRDVVAAFNAHQRTDKGFGPALGPDAAAALRRALGAFGYACVEGDSAWRLGPNDHELSAALIDGIATAAAETPQAPAGLGEWTAFRLAAASSGGVEVGHVDLALSPPFG